MKEERFQQIIWNDSERTGLRREFTDLACPRRRKLACHKTMLARELSELLCRLYIDFGFVVSHDSARGWDTLRRKEKAPERK